MSDRPSPSSALPPGDTPPPAGRRRGWLKAALVVSVALNLGFIGLAAGNYAAHHRDRDSGTARDGLSDRALATLGLRVYATALDRGDRRAMLRTLAGRRDELQAGRAALRESFGALVAALRADPFEPAAVSATLEAQGRHAAAQLRVGREVLVGRIAAMDPAERRAFADRIEAAIERRGR